MKHYTPEDVLNKLGKFLVGEDGLSLKLVQAKEIADLINAAVKEAVGEKLEYIAALEDFENSVCGKPKRCGHDYYDCICPSDRLRAIRARGMNGDSHTPEKDRSE